MWRYYALLAISGVLCAASAALLFNGLFGLIKGKALSPSPQKAVARGSDAFIWSVFSLAASLAFAYFGALIHQKNSAYLPAWAFKDFETSLPLDCPLSRLEKFDKTRFAAEFACEKDCAEISGRLAADAKFKRADFRMDGAMFKTSDLPAKYAVALVPRGPSSCRIVVYEENEPAPKEKKKDQP